MVTTFWLSSLQKTSSLWPSSFWGDQLLFPLDWSNKKKELGLSFLCLSWMEGDLRACWKARDKPFLDHLLRNVT